jgi:hypothetical protein
MGEVLGESKNESERARMRGENKNPIRMRATPISENRKYRGKYKYKGKHKFEGKSIGIKLKKPSGILSQSILSISENFSHFLRR